jgi:hypothetical protein
MPRVLVPSAYALLLAAAIGLVVVNVLVWSGGLIDDPSAPAERVDEQPASVPPPSPPPTPQTVSRPRAPRPSPPPSTQLTISATRGDCWVEVRAGSSTGRLLYEGTLAAGNSIRFNREKLWLRLGAASNVDVVVNGRPSEVPPGTVELLLPA